MKAFNADGITLQQFNEPAGGQVVFHLHFHVLPRLGGRHAWAAHLQDGKARSARRSNAEKIQRRWRWRTLRNEPLGERPGCGSRRADRTQPGRDSSFAAASCSPIPRAAFSAMLAERGLAFHAGTAGSVPAARQRRHGRPQDHSTSPSCAWPRPRTSRRCGARRLERTGPGRPPLHLRRQRRRHPLGGERAREPLWSNREHCQTRPWPTARRAAATAARHVARRACRLAPANAVLASPVSCATG